MSARYGRFFAGSVATVIGLCAVGWIPTRRLGGPEAPVAMAAGCGISFVSAALAGLLLTIVPGDTPDARMRRGMLAMIVRASVVLVLGAAAALSGEFPRSPLLLWVAIAYVALLPLEVRLAIL